MQGQGGDASLDDAARKSLDELVQLPYVGQLIGLILLPRWCYDSIVAEASGSGRSAASLVVWALGWSIAMALGIVVASAVSFLVGWPGVTLLIWLAVPFVVGGMVGRRTPGLGGLAVGLVGLVIGGALVGVFLSAFSVLAGALARPSDGSAVAGPLIYVPAMTVMVPILTGAQFGVGLLVVTMAGRSRVSKR